MCGVATEYTKTIHTALNVVPNKALEKTNIFSTKETKVFKLMVMPKTTTTTTLPTSSSNGTLDERNNKRQIFRLSNNTKLLRGATRDLRKAVAPAPLPPVPGVPQPRAHGSHRGFTDLSTYGSAGFGTTVS